MLHRAAHAERQVQLGIDDHAGGADLSVVVHPRSVGDDAGRAHDASDRAGEPVQLDETIVAVEAGAAADDRARLAEVHGLHVGWQHLDDPGIVSVGGRRPAADVEMLHGGRFGECERTANAGLQRGDERAVRSEFVQLQPTPASDPDAVGADLGGT